MQARRGLSDADRAAWASFTQSIAPNSGRARSAPVIGAVAVALSPALQPPRQAAALLPGLGIGQQAPGVDSATWQRFRTGKLAAARTLDLHGRTAQRAFHALEHFLRSAQADRLRCVEVITGHGTATGTGVIRRELPLWLNLPTLRPLVLAATHPHPANPGAVRLLLRRIR